VIGWGKIVLLEEGEERFLDRWPSNLPINGHASRHVEVLHGPERRRRWTAEQKARIVAESFELGAVASSVALRHGLHRNQLYAWRREFHSAAIADAGISASDFVPVVAESRTGSCASPIEIEIGGAIVRVGPGVELAFLGEVLGLLRATA